MEILERIWEFLSGFFSGILRRFEKSVTAIFGSSNERMIKKLHAHFSDVWSNGGDVERVERPYARADRDR